MPQLRFNPITAKFDLTTDIIPGGPVSGGPFTDNAIIRGDGGGQGVQDSGITISDADVVTGITQLNVDNIRIDGNTISSTNANGDINLTPNGSGVIAGTELTLTTALSPQYGGTGLSSLTDGGILLGSGTSAVTVTAQPTDGQLLIGSSGSDPTLSTLTAGTGITITNGAGSIQIDAASAVATSFVSDSGTATPSSNILNVLGGTAMDTSGSGNTLTIAWDIAEVSDVPNTFATDSGNAVPAANILTVAGGTGISTSGAGSTVTVTLDTPVSVGNGGTGASSLTDGGIVLGSAAAAVTVTAQPTNGQLLIGSSGVDPVLGTLTAPAAGITITEGAGTITFALANGLAALEALSGTGLVVHTGADTYTERTIVGTSPIVVTNGSGVSDNPTISVTGGGLPWTVVTGATQAAAVNNGYITNRAAGVTVTLPDTAAVGSILRIAGMDGNWVLAQNAGETIYFGTSATTTGVGGSLTATDNRDCVELVCSVADTDWIVLSSIGNITVA